MSIDITGHVIVPVADESDARATAEHLDSYTVGHITVLYVVEKGEGVPDKTPVEQSEQIGRDAFDAFHETFPDADTEMAYRRDIAEAITDAARKVDATAIVFRSRQSSRVRKLLAGNTAGNLLRKSDRPVIKLPTQEEQ